MKTAKDWVIKFNNKVEECLLNRKYSSGQDDILSDSEAESLGLKNEEKEVEKFIETNTQMIDNDKYLCPLSGKKFKGKDYVRKHIMNKHGEKVDNVKKEVTYFNRYVRDANKDGPAEPRFVTGRSGGYGHGNGHDRHSSHNGHMNGGGYERGGKRDYNGSYRGGGDSYNRGGGYNDRYNSRGGHQTGYNPGSRRGGYGGGSHNYQEQEQMRRVSGGRGMVDYRDLDAPENMDMFG